MTQSSRSTDSDQKQPEQLLKENLLAEYQRQQTTECVSTVVDTETFDEDRVRRLEELRAHENKDRFLDIVNVHAAAANALQNQSYVSYRSHEDTLEHNASKRYYGATHEELIDQYGLYDRQGNVPDQEMIGDKDGFVAVDNRETLSEFDHYEKKVKRENFVNLFLHNYDVDKYIVTHLYGCMGQLDLSATVEDVDGFFEASALNLSTTFAKRAHRVEKQTQNVRKMSPRETFIALIKGYCATAILLLPKTYQNGGMGITSIFIACSAIISTICIGKLIDAGLATKLYSYSLIVERALGKNGRFCLDVMVALTQFSFTIAGIIFIVNTFKTTFDSLLGIDSNPWIYGAIIILIYTPISWVRNIAKFSFTFMLGNLLILLAVLFVSVYCCMVLARNDGPADGIKFINQADYLSALGMSVYCFEGIGIVMPIMHSSEKPESFKSILTSAIATLTIIYIIFGSIGYLAWGSGEIEPYATDMLPEENIAVILMKFLFSFNLIFSYSITIQPCNQILGNWFCSTAPQGNCKYWLKNLQRTCVVVAAVLLALSIADKIDKFLGLVGALLCAPLAMTIPSLIHLRLLAKTKMEKMVDMLLITGSLGVLAFSTIQSVTAW